ncbi:MAG: hypothetical protein ACYDHO_00520 [Gaiellaceae bacterium]
MAGRSSLSPRALIGLASEQRELESKESGPLVVSGARRPASALVRELSRGAAPDSVVLDGDLERAEALVYLLRGREKSEDKRRLRAAERARVPVICVRIGGEKSALPGVLATNVIELESSAAVPADEVGRLLARRLEGRATALAARIPALRAGVCDELIQHSARRAGAIGAAAFVPAADLPALFLEQARLILRLGYAHDRRLDPKRGIEIAAVLAAGLGLRRLARRVRHATIIPAWALQSSIAYGGTRALGDAALRYFSAQDSE